MFSACSVLATMRSAVLAICTMPFRYIQLRRTGHSSNTHPQPASCSVSMERGQRGWLKAADAHQPVSGQTHTCFMLGAMHSAVVATCIVPHHHMVAQAWSGSTGLLLEEPAVPDAGCMAHLWHAPDAPHAAGSGEPQSCRHHVGSGCQALTEAITAIHPEHVSLSLLPR